MPKYLIEESTLTGIANAIREKDGSTGEIPVSNMASRIIAIETGGDLESFVTVEYDDSLSNLSSKISIGTDMDSIVFQPPSNVDVTGVENFCVRVTSSNTSSSEYRDFYILNLNETSSRSVRYFYSYWTGASNPNSTSATIKNTSRGYGSSTFNESGVFTLEPNSSFFSGFSNPTIHARITYKL